MLLVVLCKSIGGRGDRRWEVGVIGDRRCRGRESRVYPDVVFFPLRFRGVTNMYWEWVGGGK